MGHKESNQTKNYFLLIWYATWPHSDCFYLLTWHTGWRCMNMCLHGALCSIPINLICNMTTFREKSFNLWPHPRVEGVCKDRICVCMVIQATFALIWYATWLLSEKVYNWTFWSHLAVEGMCKDRISAYMVLYVQFPLILICNMITFSKKCFDLLTPPLG